MCTSMENAFAPSGRCPPIGDYALIGDCRGAALISREGSLDWLCFPRFDSPSLFGALLDADNGGRFSIHPIGPCETERRYRPDTAIVETTMRGAEGALVLRDLMPVASEDEKHAALVPDHEVLRELEGLAGEVQLAVRYDPRPGYGRVRPALTQRGQFGLWGEAAGAVVLLRTHPPLSWQLDGQGAHATLRLRAGERAYLSLTYSEEAPTVIPPLGRSAAERLARSERWWRGWAGRCRYDGPYRQAVLRSAITLKLLTYAPSGAVVAAPTTSLPEHLGGVRNWDYRYCWLRDAAFTLRALFALGYVDEATAFVDWLLHATRLTWPELQVVYNVFGEAKLPERELVHLAGYAGSRPVRVGNDAHGQLQLDVYGEVIDAAAQFVHQGGRLDRETSRLLRGLGETVCRRWRESDEGIWEGRAGRFPHLHSKVLCWVALDRLIDLHEGEHLQVPVERFRRERTAIRAAIETHGYNDVLGSYTQLLDGDTVDASLLVLPLYGYCAASDDRMRRTYRRIHDELSRGSLLYRYKLATDDGLPPGEGAFGICSFWAVECLALGGELDRATAAFEHLLSYANDVGLLAEE
ncbi:MAG TPA: glycoside hydrolase family 15 protein, partial [Dehalococcoidia bacterium]